MNPSTLYKDYKPALNRVLGRLVADSRDREEIVHDAFLRIFQKYETYDPSQATLYTWMRRITVNTAIPFLRRRSLDWKELDMEGTPVFQGHADYTQYLNCLQPASKRVLQLFVIEGYSHKEIGQLLGISEGTSKWHVSEGRRILKQKINIYE